MKVLSLDIGTKRTGCAYVDESVGVPLPLDTIQHQTMDELVEKILTIIKERDVGHVVAGLPLLPSGHEGAQADIAIDVADRLREANISVEMLDERYSTPRNTLGDGDAIAACSLLLVWQQRS